MSNGSLLKVESIAECSPWSISRVMALELRKIGIAPNSNQNCRTVHEVVHLGIVCISSNEKWKDGCFVSCGYIFT